MKRLILSILTSMSVVGVLSAPVLLSPPAFAQVGETIRPVDTKPRIVMIKARLIEIRMAKNGLLKEALIQAPTISTADNTRGQLEINSSHHTGMKLAVLPHLNRDSSVSMQVSLALRVASGDAITSSEFNTATRLTKQGTWKAIRTISLSSDRKVPSSVVRATTKDRAAYPLYRLEVSAAETE